MARRDGLILLVALLLVVHPLRGNNDEPVDDAYRFGCLSQHLDPLVNSNVHREFPARVGILAVERTHITTGCRIYLARVTVNVHGFVQGAHVTCADRLANYHHSFSESPPRAFPLMEPGHEYFFASWPGGEEIFKGCVKEAGWTTDIVGLSAGVTMRVDLRNLRAILPQLTELVHVALDLPDSEKPAGYRRWALTNLETTHEFLRSVVERELESNVVLYRGATQDEADRLAAYSEKVSADVTRFCMLRNLATETPHSVERWFVRMLKPPPGAAKEPHDTASFFAFDDIIAQAAPHMSIDPFLPLMSHSTRYLGPLVRAFAVKADPRLLPMIVPHLKPGPTFDPEAVHALAYYKGNAEAARALTALVAETKDLSKNRQAADAVIQSLRQLESSEAAKAADALEREAQNLPHETAH